MTMRPTALFRALVVTLASCILWESAFAQGPNSVALNGTRVDDSGRIVGRVLDASQGEPLAGVQVFVQGTTMQTMTGVDGRYALANVPTGKLDLGFRRIGYQVKRIAGVEVPQNGSVEIDATLAPQVVQLEEIVVVSAAAERGSVSHALEEQRLASSILNSVSMAQIEASPDGDAAEAAQRVSGVTVQDGKYVFVRGLGERYTTTSLNGARVPSPEPEKKEVPLDLFPSNLLEAITTSKTFTPDRPGDFSGAEVNLRTREFPAHRMAQISMTGGWNSEATGKTMAMPVTAGREWLAMAASQRALPAQLTQITDFTRLTQSDINSLIRSFPHDWSFTPASAPPNVSGGLSFGGEDPVLGQRIGYAGSLTYSNGYELHADELRARAVPGDSLGTPVPYNPFHGSTGQSSVLWGGLLNLTSYVGSNNKLEFNNTYSRSAENQAHEDWGTIEEFAAQVDSVRRTSLDYVERAVRSNQLRGEHEIGGHHRVTWSGTSSSVSRVEPDRSSLAYGYEFAPTGERLPLAWLGFIPEAAKRTSSDLHESALAGDLDYALSIGQADRAVTLKVGGAYRRTERDASTSSYNLRALGLSAAQRAATPEQLFYGAYTDPDSARILLEPNVAGGNYNANDKVAAGYLMAEVPLGRLRVIGGARLERWKLAMTAQPSSGARVNIGRTNTDVLPALALNVTLGEGQTLRLSASQTLARPEYRELAPISYRDMLGEREIFGDSSLVRTLVQNYDLRWEWYPGLNEVVSVGAFAKRFDNPIEEIDVATSGVSQLSFINAASAFNYGVEVELRKGLGFLAENLQPFGVFTNVTLMKSRINTSNSGLSALTNDERPMVGQAPYVVNAGLSYTSPSSPLSVTALYNVVGKRITYAAVTPVRVDTYEQPRHQIDVSARFPLVGGISGKIEATNLLNSPYEERQGDVIRYHYLTGRSVSLGFSWQTR
jgi:hypothetical protein